MDIITAILSVFSAIGTWIVSSVNDVLPMFWTAASGSTPGSLTFLGALAVAGLAFSVMFLVIGIVQRFLKFRG